MTKKKTKIFPRLRAGFVLPLVKGTNSVWHVPKYYHHKGHKKNAETFAPKRRNVLVKTSKRFR